MTIIGVDPHKSLHEACALDGEAITRLRMTSSRTGYQKLITWAQSFPERTWAIEGAHGLGRHLAQFLVARGERVVDVPAFLSARVRELGRSGNRKTDQIDALATALAARDATDLHQVQPEDTTTGALRQLRRRRPRRGRQRRTNPTPPLARRQPPAQLRDPPDRAAAGPPQPRRRTCLLRTQDRRGQDRPRSDAMPQAPPRDPALPRPPRRSPATPHRAGTCRLTHRGAPTKPRPRTCSSSSSRPATNRPR